eukprot:8399205-Ditylum_brightwellii.AAC.1
MHWEGKLHWKGQLKNVLTPSNLDDAIRFTQVLDNKLGPAGLALNEEARGQIEYGRHMACLDRHLEHKTYQTIEYNLVPCMWALFKNAADLYEKNPKFQSSLIVALLKAVVVQECSCFS